MRDVSKLPDNIPTPEDDGGASHLEGVTLPSFSLLATNGNRVTSEEFKKSILFIYPKAGSPLEEEVDPAFWDMTPGARGCTPQACGFRDLCKEFEGVGFNVLGLSVQSHTVQKEFVERNHIPFLILSDEDYVFSKTLNLPTFTFAGRVLLKRMALVIERQKITKVFYPVFPPDKNAEIVLKYIREKRT